MALVNTRNRVRMAARKGSLTADRHAKARPTLGVVQPPVGLPFWVFGRRPGAHRAVPP